MTLLHRYASRQSWTQSSRFAEGLQARGWVCLFVSGGFLITHPSVDAGVARVQRASRVDIPQIEEICGRLGAQRIVIEPGLRGIWIDAEGRRRQWDVESPLRAEDVRASRPWAALQHPIAHTRTNVVDLAPRMEDVVASFSSIARRNLRKAHAAPIRYETVAFDQADAGVEQALRGLYEAFLAAHGNLGDEWPVRRSITTHFADRGHHVLAWSEGKLVGAIDLLIHDRVASYFAAMSDPSAMRARAPTGLVHAAMELAQAEGCDLFDFVGVYDDRFPSRRRSWVGFSTFKARFGGLDVCFDPGIESA